MPVQLNSEMIGINSTYLIYFLLYFTDCHNIFSLIVKNCLDLKESKSTVYSFTVTDESIEKSNYLHKICHQIAQVVCRTDTVSI